jgi:hypothetical protein
VSELEQTLRSIGRELDVPEAPELTSRVLRGLGPSVRARPTRRLVAVFAVLLAAALVATLAIPEARSALLRFLQIGSERIELVDELPEVSPVPAELDLGRALGERVSLAEARRRAGFDLLELPEPPDQVYLGARGTVWFLYGRPAAVRLLVAQTTELEIDEPFILKKLVGAGTHVEEATVRGVPAYFLSGDPHVVMLLDENGIPYQETARLARDVLVWEEHGRTIRLEGDFTRADAVALADSLR